MISQANGITFELSGPPAGLPVIFIHGFPLTRAMWRPQIEYLSKAYRCLTYDVRGHGQSPADGAPFTIEHCVDDLAAVMDAAGVRQAVLCGLSMGGYIALRAVERCPERVSALVLCDTKSEADTNEAKIKRAAAIDVVRKKGVQIFAGDFLRTVLGDTTLQQRPEVLKEASELVRSNTSSGVQAALMALAARTDTTAALGSIRVPTLVLVGEEDRLTPVEGAKAMAARIPGGKVSVIPGAGHLSNLENPAAFNGELGAFLAGIQKSVLS